MAPSHHAIDHTRAHVVHHSQGRAARSAGVGTDASASPVVVADALLDQLSILSPSVEPAEPGADELLLKPTPEEQAIPPGRAVRHYDTQPVILRRPLGRVLAVR